MIYLYSGTPGSGKSLDMARCILNDLRVNRPVICNFPISLYGRLAKKSRFFNYWNNDMLMPSALVDFSDNYFKNHKFKEGGIALYIDECQLLFNARTWNIKGRSDWNAFFTNHRHFGFDIILVAQFDRMIDRQIRSLIEVEVVHRKINQLGIKGLFLRIILVAPTLFVKIHFYYPLHEKTGAQFFRYNPRYARIYDSYSNIFIKDNYFNENSVVSSSERDARTEDEVSRSERDTTSIYDKYSHLVNITMKIVKLIA